MRLATNALAVVTAAVLAGLAAGLEGFTYTAWVLERDGREPAAEGLDALTALMAAGVFALQAAVAAGAALGLHLAGRRTAARIVVAALVAVLAVEHVVPLAVT